MTAVHSESSNRQAVRLTPGRFELAAEMRRLTGSRDGMSRVIAEDALLPAGKLLRPMLCLEAATAVGGDAETVLSFAAGLECMHVGSLVHDDIVDQDPVRRSRASTHAHYGLCEALLAGDDLMAMGISVLLESASGRVPPDVRLRAVRTVIDALGKMCQASQREIMLRGDPTADVAESLNVVEGKTAALVGASCAAGAILAGARDDQVVALHRYGLELGMAFQVCDDLLPYTSSDNLVGKQAISDVANRQPTVPVLLAFARAEPSDRRRLVEIFAAPDSRTAHTELAALLARTGAIDEAASLADAYAERAHAALTDLPATAARDRLADFARSAAHRDR